jgi:hypothetical protein
MDCACRIIAHLTDINLHHKKYIPLPHVRVAWQDPVDPRHLCVESFGEGVPLPDGNCHRSTTERRGFSGNVVPEQFCTSSSENTAV